MFLKLSKLEHSLGLKDFFFFFLLQPQLDCKLREAGLLSFMCLVFVLSLSFNSKCHLIILRFHTIIFIDLKAKKS